MKRQWLGVWVCVAMLSLFGCGGGGGGDGGGTAAAPGGGGGTAAAPVAITDSNQKLVAGEAYSSKDTVRSTSQAGGGLTGTSASSTARAGVVDVVNAVLDHLRQGDTGKLLNGTVSAMSVETETLDCDISGSVTLTFNDADNDEDISAGDSVSITFHDCQGFGGISITLDGDMSMTFSALSGEVGIPPWSLTVGAQVTDLRYSTIPGWPAGDAFTGNGNMTIVISVDDTSVDSQAHTAKLQATFTGSKPETATITDSDLHFTVFVGSGSYQFTLSGTWSSDRLGGSISYRTTQPFKGTGSSYPYEGQMVITGANNSQLTMTVIDSTSVQLDLDANGDGTVEKTTVVPWTSIQRWGDLAP